MLGKAHLAIGSAIGFIASCPLASKPELVLVSAFIASVAGGLPDVLDSEHAAGRAPLGVSWSSIKRDARRKRLSIVEAALLIPRAVGALLLDIVSRILPHRGLTHWLTTWFLLSALAAEISALVGLGVRFSLIFSLGYLSHLLADGMTVSGVELFAPLYDQPIYLLPHGLRFRYDSPVQWFIVLASYGVALAVWYPQLTALAGGLR